MLGFLETRIGRWLRSTFGGVEALRDVVPVALLIAACTLLVKLLAAGKELIIAFQVGTSAELDAFLFAYMFPAFLINILAASFQSAFIPRYIRIKAESSSERAKQFAAQGASLCASGLALTALVVAPLLGIAIPHLAKGFDSMTVTSTQSFLYMLMPIVLLSGLASFWSGVLNAEKQYAVPALTPIATPILVALALWGLWEQLGIFSIVIGTLLGAFVEVSLVAIALRRLEIPMFSYVNTINADQRAMFQQFVPAALAGLLMSGTMVVDQTMAATLVSGSVSSLSFGTKLTAVVTGVIVMAITTATLPFFSRLVSRCDWGEIRRSLGPGVLAVALVSVASTAFMWFESENIVRVLFERGRFTAQDTVLVSGVQAWHSLQIPFYALSMVAYRLIAAMAATRLLLVGAGLNLVSDVVFNLILVPANGVVGVAMANLAMYMVSCAFLWVVAVRHLRKLERTSHLMQ